MPNSPALAFRARGMDSLSLIEMTITYLSTLAKSSSTFQTGVVKRILAFFAALLLFAGAASAQHFDGLAVAGTYRINSLWPESFSSVKGVVTVKMSNTGERRVYKDIRAVLYRNGTAFLNGTCNDIVVAKGESEVTITGRASLGSGVSIFSVLGSALLTDLSAYTADIYFTDVAPDGSAVKVARQGVPLSNYLKH